MKYVIIGILSLTSISSTANDYRDNVFEAKEKKLVLECTDNKNNDACEELYIYYLDNNNPDASLAVADFLCFEKTFNIKPIKAFYCMEAGMHYLYVKKKLEVALPRFAGGCEGANSLEGKEFKLLFESNCLVVAAYENKRSRYLELMNKLKPESVDEMRSAYNIAWANAVYGNIGASLGFIERYAHLDTNPDMVKYLKYFSRFNKIKESARYQKLLESYAEK